MKKAKADKVAKVNGAGGQDGEAASKPKRVRTGCLTCRERHLKCDEGLPHCMNCQKSSRVCKRGLRLNFIDIWMEQPPTLLTLFGTAQWKVTFNDESRDIADEYEGGLEKYPPQEEMPANAGIMDPRLAFDFAQHAPAAPTLAHQMLPPTQGGMQDAYPEPPAAPEMSNVYDPYFKSDAANNHLQPPPSGSTVQSRQSNHSNHSSIHPGSVGSYDMGSTDILPTVDEARKDYLDDPEG